MVETLPVALKAHHLSAMVPLLWDMVALRVLVVVAAAAVSVGANKDPTASGIKPPLARITTTDSEGTRLEDGTQVMVSTRDSRLVDGSGTTRRREKTLCPRRDGHLKKHVSVLCFRDLSILVSYPCVFLPRQNHSFFILLPLFLFFPFQPLFIVPLFSMSEHIHFHYFHHLCFHHDHVLFHFL